MHSTCSSLNCMMFLHNIALQPSFSKKKKWARWCRSQLINYVHASTASSCACAHAHAVLCATWHAPHRQSTNCILRWCMHHCGVCKKWNDEPHAVVVHLVTLLCSHVLLVYVCTCYACIVALLRMCVLRRDHASIHHCDAAPTHTPPRTRILHCNKKFSAHILHDV